MTKRPSDAAIDLAIDLAKAVADLPSFQHDRPGYDRAIDAIRATIIAEGGAIRSDWQGTRLRIHGVTASSTSGAAQACKNWVAQVVLKTSAATLAATVAARTAEALS